MRFGVLSWNARGINDPHRRKEVYKTALFTHADIICLQETWLSPETQPTDFGWKGPQLWSPSLSPSQHKHAGVAILCKRWIAKLKPIFKVIIPGRAISMDIQMDGKTTRIITCYMSLQTAGLQTRMGSSSNSLRSLTTPIQSYVETSTQSLTQS